MADAAEANEALEEGEEGGKGGNKMIIIIAAVGVVVLLGIGAAVYFLFLSGGDEDAPVLPDEIVEASPDMPTFFYDLPEMKVNLSPDGSGDEHFLQLNVSLEVSDETLLEPIGNRATRVMDAFQVYLRELRRSDLEGSAGIYRLKEELRRRVNLAVYPATVDDILFREILVQ